MDAEAMNRMAASYTGHLEDLDSRFASLVAKAKNKTLIFAERFPFRYFVDEYGLDYYAAFPGCSEQTEASPRTISYLMMKAKETGAKVVFKTEMSNGNLANMVAEATGARVKVLNAAHTVSESNFTLYKRFVDLLEDNYVALQEALY